MYSRSPTPSDRNLPTKAAQISFVNSDIFNNVRFTSFRFSCTLVQMISINEKKKKKCDVEVARCFALAWRTRVSCNTTNCNFVPNEWNHALMEAVAAIFRVQRSSFIRGQHLFPKNRLAENERLKLWPMIASRILEIFRLNIAAGERETSAGQTKWKRPV